MPLTSVEIANQIIYKITHKHILYLLLYLLPVCDCTKRHIGRRGHLFTLITPWCSFDANQKLCHRIRANFITINPVFIVTTHSERDCICAFERMLVYTNEATQVPYISVHTLARIPISKHKGNL
jgi:hypothetical protein